VYGVHPYAVVTNSAFSNIIIITACIHIDSQKIYDCTFSTSLIYTAEIYHSMVYLTDVNITEGEC
jgi:hypothetical protein